MALFGPRQAEIFEIDSRIDTDPSISATDLERVHRYYSELILFTHTITNQYLTKTWQSVMDNSLDNLLNLLTAVLPHFTAFIDR